jgi:ribonuclease HI
MGKYHAHPAASGSLREVHAWTDGSNLKDAGGWAAILVFGEHEKELSGSVRDESVTNNRMEMMGALEALYACKNPVDMTIHTDSRYVADGWTMYLPGWVRRDWKKADKSDVANQDLWRAFLIVAKVHTFRFAHVKGHNGNELNERADELAGVARLEAASWAPGWPAPSSEEYAERANQIVYNLLGV